MDLKSDNGYLRSIFNKITYRDLIIFLIPFIIYMFYLYVYNPGIIRVDAFNQLHQIATSTFANWHPFFHTFIEMMCLKVYPNPISIGIFQIVIFSGIWTAICNYFRHNEKSKDFILQVIFTLIIALIPVNAIFSITYLKDTLFSYFLLLTCFLIKVLVDRKGDVGLGFIVIFSLAMACVAQIRPNGMIIIIVLLAVLFIYLFRKNRPRKTYVLIPAVTIIFILLIASLNVVYDVEDNQKDAVLTKVVHMLADYDLNLNLESSDRDKIHMLFNESTIKKNYEPTFSDSIYHATNRTAYNNDKFTYISMAIEYSLKNPGHFVKYLFKSSPMTWDIVRDDSWHGVSYITNTNREGHQFYTNYNMTPASTYDNATFKDNESGLFKALNSMANFIKKDKLLDTLFESPALYMYLSLILVGTIYVLTKSKGILLVYLPNLLNILTIFVSTPTQDSRYLYPNLLVFYLLVIILIGILTRPKDPEAEIRAKVLKELKQER